MKCCVILIQVASKAMSQIADFEKKHDVTNRAKQTALTAYASAAKFSEENGVTNFFRKIVRMADLIDSEF